MTDDLSKKNDTSTPNTDNASMDDKGSNTPSSDTPASPASPVDEETAEKRRQMRARMMQDAPGNQPDPNDTVESLHREKVILMQQLATMMGEKQQLAIDLRRAQEENEQMRTLMARAKENLQEALANAEAAAKKSIERVTRQAQEDNKLAVTKFVKAQMPVIDDIEVVMNAITPEARAKDKEVDTIAKGVEITMKKLMTVFNNFGVKQINPINEEFDETKGHEAIGLDEKAKGFAPGTVVKVAQKGYEVNGEIVRTAKVVTTPLA